MKIITRLMSMMLMIMMLAAPSAYADNIVAGDVIQLRNGDYGTTNGGPFSLYKGGIYQFDTFCVETNEYFSYNEALTVASVTKQAMNGGTGGGSPDPLGDKTAYLYYHFRLGDLSTLSGGTFSYNTDTGMNDLQKAIWKFEEETAYVGVTNTLVTLANNASATDLQMALANVSVLNLTRVDATTGLTVKAQDQLTANVPEPGTLLLLGLGLIGLSGVRKIMNRRAFASSSC